MAECSPLGILPLLPSQGPENHRLAAPTWQPQHILTWAPWLLSLQAVRKERQRETLLGLTLPRYKDPKYGGEEARRVNGRGHGTVPAPDSCSGPLQEPVRVFSLRSTIGIFHLCCQAVKI